LEFEDDGGNDLREGEPGLRLPLIVLELELKLVPVSSKADEAFILPTRTTFSPLQVSEKHPTGERVKN
jgi:hypothetical protein